MKRFKVAMVGLGHFGRGFIPLFKHHPFSEELVLCEKRPDVLAEQAKEHEVKRTYTSFDDVLKSDVDAVAIFTQRWTHARLAIQALKAGKHVYSAVPAGVHVDELEELVKTVEQTGLTYALGETSYYRPQTIWCRQKFAEGAFGRFVYAEGHYYHDMAHWFYRPFYDANGPEWKRYASVPPMWYISHSGSHVLSVTMGHFTKVSCMGWSDDHEDGIFDVDLSAFENDFANQTALFRTADGGMARINEFRRSAAGESRGNIVGTKGAYQEQTNPERRDHTVEEQIKGTGHDALAVARNTAVWTEKRFSDDPHKEDGSFDFVNAQHYSETYKEDVSWIHQYDPDGVLITEENLGDKPRSCLGKRYASKSPLHPVERIPEEYIGLPSGHGSGQILVHDFFEGMATGKLPPNHVWIAARYSVGGAVAHESSKRGGELLSVPDFGTPPDDKECIDPLVKLKE
jgi:predicted dehydrogenase